MIKHFILPVPYALDKYFYIADEYEKVGRDVTIVSQDVLKKDLQNSLRHTAKLVIIKGNSINRFIKTCRVLINCHPSYIDLYDYTIYTILFIFLTRILKIKTTFFIIGSELKIIDKHIKSRKSIKPKLVKILKTPLTWLSLFLSNNIVIKEYHQYKLISRFKSLMRKTIFLPNSVPVPKYKKNNFLNCNDFIYYNAILKSRHVTDIIEAFSQLNDKEYIYRSKIVGFYTLDPKTSSSVRDHKAEQDVLKLAGIYELKNLELVSFSNDSESYFTESKYFLFPADTVFLNYALLEAMSYGLVPIVYNGEGADKIIEHNKNGFVIEKSVANLVSALEKALNISKDEYEKLSSAAYNTIAHKFSIKSWVHELDTFRKIYKEQV